MAIITSSNPRRWDNLTEERLRRQDRIQPTTPLAKIIGEAAGDMTLNGRFDRLSLAQNHGSTELERRIFLEIVAVAQVAVDGICQSEELSSSDLPQGIDGAYYDVFVQPDISPDLRLLTRTSLRDACPVVLVGALQGYEPGLIQRIKEAPDLALGENPDYIEFLRSSASKQMLDVCTERT
jgi:hypothetical protein